jgi:membrane-associated phospholipid phosphatase
MAQIARSSRQFALPLFLTHQNKYTIGFLVFLSCGLLYLSSNHFHLRQPRYLPLAWVDENTPFIPVTVWVYFSEYVYFPLIYVRCRDIVNANKFLYSYFALWVVSCVIFWVFPTTYPRDLFPLPESLDTVTHAAFTGLRLADTPANCAPSLHVSSVYLASFIFLDEQREKFVPYLLWATAIAAATLTTKQHYFVDIVTGFLMAVMMYGIFHRAISYRQAKR